MEVTRARLLEGAQTARGVAVIIDVFRAFSCASLLFSLGLKKSILVATPEEAFALKEQEKDFILIGEVGGFPIAGFDFGNSPTEIIRKGSTYFNGRTVVHRTSAGVQGALAALDVAEQVLLASYSVAKSTARYILSSRPKEVTLVAMGWDLKETALEDEWCARYISYLLGIGDYNHNEALRDILFSKTAQRFLKANEPEFPPEDPILCLQPNVYNFVLKAKRDEEGVVMNKIDI